MEYNDIASFQRLTGLGFFTPDGQAGAISLGNVTMLKIDYGLKSVDSKASVRGRISLRQRVYTESLPVYSIDGNQFATPLIPLLLLGDQLGDYIQTAKSAQTFTFTAAAGLAFFIGAYNLTSVVVKVGSTVKTQGIDYFLDDPNVDQSSAVSLQGVVILPVDSEGINDGDVVTVTFDQQLLSLEQYEAFTQLSRQGTLVVFAEDEDGGPGREIWTMSVQLSCKKGADIDPTQFRKFTLEAALLAKANVMRNPGIGIIPLGVGGDTFAWQ
jgi:hypothetical protein